MKNQEKQEAENNQTANSANFAAAPSDQGEQEGNTSQDNQPSTDESDKKRQNREILFQKLARTPLLPDEVYADLPQILAESSALFSFKREKDLYLLGSIAVMSGMFPRVTGIYDQKLIHPNLYLFVVAPPANGKGTLTYAQNLGRLLHERYSEEFRGAFQQYKADLRQLSGRNRQRTDNASDTAPVKPFRKVLFIPANISSSAIMGHLDHSGGIGIIFETEADTLAISLKQDWGNYSDLLRKSYHHETLTLSRKGNDEYLEIVHPRISVVLSGTLSQVKGIFPSAENGLVSRFMFYAFKASSKWRNVSPENNFSMTELFNQFSAKALQAHDFLNGSDTAFNLSHDQWHTLNEYFKSLLPYYQNIEGDVAESIIKRFGLITFRIAMVLSSLRKFENQDASNEILCSDADFNTALKIVNTLKEHSMFILDLLPDSEMSDRDRYIKTFLKALPDGNFSRNKAVSIGIKMGISKRTADNYLKRLLLAKLLKNIQYGNYKKA